MFFTYSKPDLSKSVDDLKTLLDESKKEVATLLEQPNKTYAGFVRPYQYIFEKIEWFYTPLSILNSTKNEETIQKVYEEMLPLLSEFDSDVKQNPALFEAFKTIAANETALTDAQKKLLENEILDFELSGASLPAEKQARMKTIKSRLSQLSNTFSQNVLNATNAYELILESDRDIKEMPESDRQQAEKEIDGKLVHRFTLKGPSFSAFMTYCSNSQLREQMYKAYTTRAPENDAIMEEILALRDEKAKLLGFDNYARLSLETKMARTPEEVDTFLMELAIQSLPQAKKELAELKAFAKKEGYDNLQSFDTGYYSKKLEKAQFDLDEELYRPYFEKQSVVSGLFDFLNNFFKITFERIEEDAWDEKVEAFVLKKEGEPFAKIYMDLESRDDKQGGAWMGDWRTHAKTLNDKIQLPIAYIVCNFAPSSDKTPSLLKHDDVVTLFHEMGHALHHLFSRVEEPFVSGIAGVEWDAVEFPSQFLENFAYEAKVLKMFAKHYQSGELLPDSMIDKLIEAKNFQSALAMLRQLEFGLFDIRIHKSLHNAREVQDILDNVRKTTALLTPPLYNRFQHGFTHIFSGGYAAGYYSYKWAEVLSADAFYCFVDNGIFHDETAQAYIDHVLSKGGSRTAIENFTAFMGREPDPSALIRLSGIAS